jgi:hypothetical protein
MDLTYQGKGYAFVSANPDCTFEQFQKATGCTKQSWYDSRHKVKKNGVRSSAKLQNDTKFLISNPNATAEEYIAKFGGTQHSYSQARGRAKKYLKVRGLEKLMTPFRKRKPTKVKAAPKAAEAPSNPFKQENPDQVRLEQAYARDGVEQMNEIVSLGITPDFIWYESTIIRNDFERTMSRFEHLVRVMEARQADNNKVMSRMVDDYKKLREENKSLTAILESKTNPGA